MRHREVGDRVFFGFVLSLTLAGFAIFSSATLGLLARESSSVSKDILLQAGLGLGLGLVALLVARALSLSGLRTGAPYLYAFTLFLTALVFVPGIGLTANGATRWIDLGYITFQPAEFLKIGVVVMLAAWLAPRVRRLGQLKSGLAPLLALLALPAGVLLAQPNNSTAFLLVLTGIAMYFVAGAPWKHFLIIGLIGLAVVGSILVVRPYALERVATFLDPSADAFGRGYQIQQSLIAVGSGQLFGRGFGQSVEKFNYLPEPGGDSVFAVFAEETGFIGSVLLLALFVGLVARGIVIAGNAQELFGGLVAFGFSFLLMLQAFINIGAMLGILPLTGLPLPFVSHGGTALLAVLLMCGLILNVAARRKS